MAYDDDFEREFDAQSQALVRAKQWQLDREPTLAPDDRLDELGWTIFGECVTMGMKAPDAAALAMDGNLRQRRRVLADVRRRSLDQLSRLLPPTPPDVPATGQGQLEFWRERLPAAAEFVYFIQRGDDGPVKIGLARKPERRISQLQTASPEELHLRHVIPGSRLEERTLHERFAHARLRGEWFGAQYLPIILLYSQGLAEAAVDAFDGSGPPVLAFNGAEVRGKREILRLRRDIERMYLDSHRVRDIAECLYLSEDEVEDQLAAMRKSSLYDLDAPRLPAFHITAGKRPQLKRRSSRLTAA